jgi:hypothetical protein
VTIFQGAEIGITQQISNEYVPHMQGIQCMVHHANLVVQVLSKLNMVNKLEKLVPNLICSFLQKSQKAFGTY